MTPHNVCVAIGTHTTTHHTTNTMTPKLYAADLLSAVAVGMPEPATTPTVAAVRKERSPAQIAAWEKAKATRAAKAEAAAAAATAAAAAEAAVVERAAAALAAVAAKKEARKVKRAAARVSGHATPPDSGVSVSDDAGPPPPPPPTPRKRVRRTDPDVPPKWFQDYVHSVKSEKAVIANESVPKRQLKRESTEQATNMWREPATRDRVNAEANDQMARMYSTIFAGRRLI